MMMPITWEEAAIAYRQELQRRGIEDDRRIYKHYSIRRMGHWELAIASNEIIAKVWDSFTVQWTLLEDVEEQPIPEIESTESLADYMERAKIRVVRMKQQNKAETTVANRNLLNRIRKLEDRKEQQHDPELAEYLERAEKRVARMRGEEIKKLEPVEYPDYLANDNSITGFMKKGQWRVENAHRLTQ